MVSNFRYKFDSSSKKSICPKCHKKTFVRYVDLENGDYLGSEFGKCDRVEKCNYFSPPKYDNKSNIFRPPYFKPVKPAPSFHSLRLLEKMYCDEAVNDNFTQYLDSKFSYSGVEKARSKYFISGTNKKWNNATIFWQIDEHEKVHAGKVMLYDAVSGKRVKEPYPHINWIHKILNEKDFILNQCLFGLHLINSDYSKPIAIVEAEKTAIIMSIVSNEFIWLATGNIQNLKEELLKPIKNRKIILYPDKTAFNTWSDKANKLNSLGYKIAVSSIIENSDLPEGSDLADKVLLDY